MATGGTGIVFDSVVGTHAFTFGGLGGSGNLALLDNASNAVALTVGGNNSSTNYSGALSGGNSSTFIKIGTGTLTLTGASTDSGTIKINAGDINVGAAQNGIISGPLSSTGTIIFNGGTLQYSAANQFDYSSRFATTANQPISIDTNSQNVTFVTGLQGTGSSLTKLGAGTLILTGASSFTGGTSINAGTLQIASAGKLGLGSYAGNIVDNGTLQYSSSANQILSGNISGTGSLIKDTSTSTLTLAGVNAYGSTTTNGGSGVLNITGTVNGNGSTMAIANTAGNSVVNVSGSVTQSNIYSGVGGGSGALNLLSGGNITITSDSEINFTMGVNNGGYGYFSNTGGTVNTTRFQLGGQSGQGTGIGGLMSAGTMNSTSYIIFARSGGTGDFTMTGGTLTHSANNFNLGWDGAGRSEVNLDGGYINNSGQAMVFGGGGNATGTGIINLNAGTLTTSSFTKNGTANTSYLNLSGGTLRSSSSTASFLPSLTASGTGAVTINGAFGTFAGGAVIDTNGFNDTISAPLLASTGSGVTTIAVTNGGSGYIGAPYVSISGTGTGATAIANMIDDGSGTGTLKILSITITNPGNNYTGTPTYTLTGGGPAVAATVGTVSIAANNSTGGFTKLGTGILTLNSSASNTYTGATTINGGGLTLDFTNLASQTNLINSSSALVLGGSGSNPTTLTIKGGSTGNTSQTFASLSLNTGAVSNIVLNTNSNVTGTLTLNITSSTLSTGAGASLNFNYVQGTTNGSTVGNDIVAWAPTLTLAGIIGGGYTVTDVGGSGFATVIGGQVVRFIDNGTSGLPVSGGSASNNYFNNQSYDLTFTSPTTPGSLVEALSGNVAANTVTVDTTGPAASYSLTLGTNTLTLTNGGGYTFSGSNPYTITASGAGGLATSTSGGTMIFNNYNTSTVTINAPVLANGANSVIFNGSGKTILSASNSYSGGTNLNNGTLSLGNLNALGSGTFTINGGAIDTTVASLANNNAQAWNNNFTFIGSNALNMGTGAVTLGNNVIVTTTANTLTEGGAISGNFSLTKAGTGTMILTGANTFTGALTILGGAVYTNTGASLILANTTGAAIQSSDVEIGNGTVFTGPSILKMGAANQFGSSSVLTFNANGFPSQAVLKLMGFNQTVAGISSGTDAQNTLENAENESGAAAATLTINTSGNYTYAGTMRNINGGTSGALSLVKTGSGTQTLSGGAITYTGATAVNSGMLQLTNMNNAYTSITTVANGATLQLTNTFNQGFNAAIVLTNGATLIHNGQTNNGDYITDAPVLTVSGSTTLNENSVTNTTSASKNLFLDGGLAGSGTLTINAAAAGNAVELRNNNSNGNFVGTIVVNGIASTTVNAGSGISVGGATTSLSNADIQLNGTMELHDQGLGWAGATPGALSSFTMGALSGSGVIVGNSSVGTTTTLTLGNTGNSGTFSGIIANGTNDTINLVLTGGGSETFSGANTYTGATTINGGKLVLDYSTNPTVLATSALLTLNNSTLALKGNSAGATSQTLGNLTLGSGSNNNVLNSNGGSCTNLTLGSTWNRAAGSTLLVDLSSGSATLTSSPTLTNGILVGAWVKDTTGAGMATVSGGLVVRYDDTTIGQTLLNSTNDGGFEPGSTYTTLHSAYSIGSHILAWTNGGLCSRSVNSLAIDTTINGGIIDMGTAGNVLTLNTGSILFHGANNETLQGGQVGVSGTEVLIHQVGSGKFFLGSNIGGSSLTVDGTGSTVLAGTNTYTGATNINSGTLALGSATAMNSATMPLNVNSGTLDVTTFNAKAGTVTLTGSGTITGALGSLTGSAFNLQSGTVSGNLVGTSTTANSLTSAVLTKSTGGTVVLSGNNTVNQVVINGGTLNLTGGNISANNVSDGLIMGNVAGTSTAQPIGRDGLGQ